MLDQDTLKIFEKLYEKTYGEILKYVVCRCSNIEDVKDIVQTIYFEVIKKLKKDESFKITKQYIFGIAKNKINSYYRFNYKAKIVSLFSNKNNEEEIEIIDNIPDEFDLQSYLINKNDVEIIWNFLKKKKVIIFKIFYLYYYSDYKIKDIANTLNISEANVKNYLYRTLKELASFMEPGGENNV